jgi:hypothetical protein
MPIITYKPVTKSDFDSKIEELRDDNKHTEVLLLQPETRTTSGDTTAKPLIVENGSVITFMVDVTAVSGTSPTLDIYIDFYSTKLGKWINQDKFTTITAADTYALAIPVRGTRYALRWVLGGTSPSFTFAASVIIIK